MNAPTWHAAGQNGAGVKVAIIDLGFQGYTALLGSELPATVNTSCNQVSPLENGEKHGAAVAEIVFATGPKSEALAEAGIHRIEAGLPAVSPDDKAAIERIVAADLPTEIYAFSRCMVSDVQLALDCGVSGVIMEVPASHHLIETAYRWPLERAIQASVEATAFAHENGLKVTFFPIDATRSSMSELLDDVEQLRAVALYVHRQPSVVRAEQP